MGIRYDPQRSRGNCKTTVRAYLAPDTEAHGRLPSSPRQLL
jgi:hypothetical protein